MAAANFKPPKIFNGYYVPKLYVNWEHADTLDLEMWAVSVKNAVQEVVKGVYTFPGEGWKREGKQGYYHLFTVEREGEGGSVWVEVNFYPGYYVAGTVDAVVSWELHAECDTAAEEEVLEERLEEEAYNLAGEVEKVVKRFCDVYALAYKFSNGETGYVKVE